MNRRNTLILKVLLFLLGAACVLRSFPWLLLGCLGLFSVIADVGVDEHRRLVRGLLVSGGLLFALGLALGATGVCFIRMPSTPRDRCFHCGYDIIGIEGKCPECGHITPLYPAAPSSRD